jgi:hypothetical protein
VSKTRSLRKVPASPRFRRATRKLWMIFIRSLKKL